MRTIRFRGKRLDNGKWVCGDLMRYCGATLILPLDMNWFDFVPRKNNPMRLPSGDYEVDSDTIGQFTGLHDKNGKEIYEGDILAIEGIKYPRHYIVSWNTEKLMFCIGDTPLYALLEAGSTTMREYIVCGNIHDNPDLIEKGGEQ